MLWPRQVLLCSLRYRSVFRQRRPAPWIKKMMRSRSFWPKLIWDPSQFPPRAHTVFYKILTSLELPLPCTLSNASLMGANYFAPRSSSLGGWVRGSRKYFHRSHVTSAGKFMRQNSQSLGSFLIQEPRPSVYASLISFKYSSSIVFTKYSTSALYVYILNHVIEYSDEAFDKCMFVCLCAQVLLALYVLHWVSNIKAESLFRTYCSLRRPSVYAMNVYLWVFVTVICALPPSSTILTRHSPFWEHIMLERESYRRLLVTAAHRPFVTPGRLQKRTTSALSEGWNS